MIENSHNTWPVLGRLKWGTSLQTFGSEAAIRLFVASINATSCNGEEYDRHLRAVSGSRLEGGEERYGHRVT